MCLLYFTSILSQKCKTLSTICPKRKCFKGENVVTVIAENNTGENIGSAIFTLKEDKVLKKHPGLQVILFKGTLLSA